MKLKENKKMFTMSWKLKIMKKLIKKKILKMKTKIKKIIKINNNKDIENK